MRTKMLASIISLYVNALSRLARVMVSAKLDGRSQSKEHILVYLLVYSPLSTHDYGVVENYVRLRNREPVCRHD